jgi:hypothetical protein
MTDHAGRPIDKYRDENLCPFCGKWHVVTNMLLQHLTENRCGFVPEELWETPGKQEP